MGLVIAVDLLGDCPDHTMVATTDCGRVVLSRVLTHVCGTDCGCKVYCGKKGGPADPSNL
jgi:hypothetical protein